MLEVDGRGTTTDSVVYSSLVCQVSRGKRYDRFLQTWGEPPEESSPQDLVDAQSMLPCTVPPHAGARGSRPVRDEATGHEQRYTGHRVALGHKVVDVQNLRDAGIQLSLEGRDSGAHFCLPAHQQYRCIITQARMSRGQIMLILGLPFLLTPVALSQAGQYPESRATQDSRADVDGTSGEHIMHAAYCSNGHQA